MKHFKQLFTALLLLCCVGTATAHHFEVGGVYYNILSGVDKTVEVTSGTNKYTGNVVIPESVTYNGTTYSVTSIGESALSNCTGLTSIEIPNSVTSIGDDAFYCCTGLTSITIPNSVTSIGDDAFNFCIGLTSVVIGNSVTSIGDDAFSACHGLTSIEIPNSVTSIGDGAFWHCDGLTSVVIPNCVTSFGENAFERCNKLTSIVVDGNNTKYDSRENCNAIIETETNTLIAGCKNTIIPNSVTSIGESAFEGCTGLTSITIPNSVTSIGNDAFSWCDGLTSITIPNSVTSIGDRAFRDCSGLTSIEIPNSVTSIGSYAFNSCSGLTSIVVDGNNTKYDSRENCNAIIETKTNTLIAGCKNTIIPNSVTRIGDRAFEGCTGLTSITIPNSVKRIGDNAFSGTAWYNNQPDGVVYAGKVLYEYKGTMPENTSITIKDGTLGIADYAFYNCDGLTSITIPNSVTRIGNDAFYGCDGLKSVINFSNLTFSKGSSNNGYVAYYADKVYNAPNGSIEGDFIFGKPNDVNKLVGYLGNATKITLPADYKGENYTIGAYAFKDNTTITSITIPNSVKSIGGWAFSGCTGLKTVINFSNLTFSKGSTDYGFVAYYADKVYNVPNGSVEGDFIFDKPNDVNTLVGYLGNATKITLPADYKGENYTIGAYAFKGNTTITNVVIPNSVTSIGNYAFEDCTGLESITIPNSVTSIGYMAFYGCTGLTSITIPNSVTSIGIYAFEDCTGLTSITIPNSVTSIGNGAFSGCTGLESITIPNSVTSIGYRAFKRCTGLESITIPNSVTSIGDYAFEDCTGLTSITIPNSVTSVGDDAFTGCTNVEKLSLDCAEVGDWFSGVSAMKEVTIGNGVTSVVASAFNGCTGLEKVCINDLVAWCGIDFGSADANPLYYAKNLFLNGALLTELSIPAEIAEVKDYAFYKCNGVTIIDIVDGVESIGNSAFYGCSNLETLYISNTIESIGDYAFAKCNNILDIKIGSKKAITASENIFSSDAYNNACLYVPNGRKFAYEKATPWNKFYIVEMDFTGIEDVKAEGERVKDVYYDLNGRTVENPANGIYILNGKKVLVK